MTDQAAGPGRRGTDLAIVAGLALVALATRAFALGDASIFGDEYFTLFHSYERAVSSRNPLSYVFVVASFELFGVSEWSMRLPAMLFGVAGVPTVYWFASRSLGRPVGLFAAVLTLFSAWHLYFSQFARFYSAVFVLGCIAYFLFYEALRQDRAGLLAWSLVATAAGVLFHLTFVMVFACCALFSLLVLLFAGARAEGLSRRVARYYVVLAVLGALAATPFLWTMMLTWRVKSTALRLPVLDTVFDLAADVQVPVAAAAAIGVVFLLLTRRWLGILFAIAIGLPVVPILIGTAFGMPMRPRYMFYALPLIFVAAGVVCARARLVERGRSYAPLALAAILVAAMLPEMASHYTERRSVDLQDAIRYVAARYEPGDRVVALTPGFDYYAGDAVPVDLKLHAYNDDLDWDGVLAPYRGESGGRTWLVARVTRVPYADGLESWLARHAGLVWRRYAKRFDFRRHGYEVFVAGSPRPGEGPS